MSRKSNAPSVADLEMMLNQRKSELKKLEKERDTLEKKLGTIDSKISVITGEKSVRSRIASFKTSPRRVTGKRFKNKKTLHATIADILKGKKNGLSVKELVEAVKASDYKTKSQDLRNTVYQCIYHSDSIKVNSKTKRWSVA